MMLTHGRLAFSLVGLLTLVLLTWGNASPQSDAGVASFGRDCPNGWTPAWRGADRNPVERAAEAERASRVVIHVAPNGHDSWSGRLAQPNQQGTDGPLASLEKARDIARASAASDIIVIGAGDYYLSRPVVFGPEDAGLIVTSGCSGTPALHGGPLLTNWQQMPNGRWTTRLHLFPDDMVGSLFVDDIAQVEARYPNAPADIDPRKGWLFAAGCGPQADAWQGNLRFCFHAGDLPPFGDPKGLVAHIVGGFQPGSQWGSDTLPVVSIDHAEHVVHTRGTAYFFTAEGSRYFMSGSGAGSEVLLDAPHEWRYDAATGRLDYIAADGSFPNAETVAGVLPTMLELKGAAGMVISGLRLADGAPQGSGKYGTDTRGYGAIRLERADGVRLLGNVIQNVGVGIHVSESKNVVIAGNEIGPTAGNGIYLGTAYGSFGKSSGASIRWNSIHDIGQVYFESAGIWFQAADNVRIAHNLIENASQFGIAGGSLWGQEDAVHGAVIEYNNIRNANRLTADGGAIKMMGEQADLMDSVIRYNIVTGTRQLMNRPDGSFWPPDYENTSEWPSPISWAIYTDGKASGIRVENNILSDNVAAVGINGGWNNVVTHNIILHGSGAAFRIDDGTGRDWHPPWAQPNRVEDNIVSIGSAAHGPVVSVYAPGHGNGYIEFARNRYKGNLNAHSFQMQPPIMATGQFGGLADFQAAGQEKGSTIIKQPIEDRKAESGR
jgi:parallel beta-helix repeat protein